MNKEDAKVINIGDSSPINISLVDNTPIPVVVDVIKNEPQPIEVYSNTSIISGAANLYELGDVASDGHQVLDSGDKKVLMLNADNKHPGKWMAGKVNLSEYAKKTELDEISNNIENTNKDLSGVKEDLLEKEAFLDEKIAEIKGNLEKTKDELIFTQKELVDAKNELSDARQRLEEQGVTVEMVVGQVNEQEQKITTAITNIESESDRVNILRSEMDGINLTITNEILSQLNEDGSDITLKIGQKIDARAETIETAVKKLREGTDETMVSWVGQKIDGRAETIETAIKKLQTGEDAELVSWVGQKIDGRAETIETAVSKLREGTDETMVSWVGQKIDAKAETITTAVIESLEEEGFATKEFVGQEIDGAKKSVTTGIMTFITEQDFSTKSFVGQEIDGAEGRITTAYEKYVEDKGYATTTFVGQEIDGVNKTITTAVAESKESIVGEDGVINSRIQAAYTSWDITGIKNSVVDQNGNYIKSSEINQKADNILITVQENDEGYKGRFSSIEANLDGVSTIIANGDNYAAIIARVNEDSSSVTIEAKKINLLGETVARELSAIKATINELTLTNAHVSGVVECVINDTVYWQLLNDGSGTLAKGNIKWNPDGSGSLASGNINWDINGNAVFNGSIESGSGKIAGWTISADCISSNREGANTKLFSNGHLVNEETDENGKLWKHWEFNYDGSGSIANNSLSWDPYGYIKLGDDVILGANELRVAQLISNVSLLLSMFELDENGDIKTKDYYADGAWHSRGLYSPSFISSGGKSDTPGTGGGTVVGANIDGVEVPLLDGILTFPAYPTAKSLGLGNIAFKNSLVIADVANLQSALEGYQTIIPDLATIRSNAANGNTAYGYFANGKLPYTSVSGTPDLSDMATKTWVNVQGYLKGITSSMVTSALGYSPVNKAGDTMTGNLNVNGARLGRNVTGTNRGFLRLDPSGDAPVDIVFGRDNGASSSDWENAYWALSSRQDSENKIFGLWRARGNSGTASEAFNSEQPALIAFPNLNVKIGEDNNYFRIDRGYKLWVNGTLNAVGAIYQNGTPLGSFAFLNSISTSSVSEGTNLYFTNARAISACDGRYLPDPKVASNTETTSYHTFNDNIETGIGFKRGTNTVGIVGAYNDAAYLCCDSYYLKIGVSNHNLTFGSSTNPMTVYHAGNSNKSDVDWTVKALSANAASTINSGNNGAPLSIYSTADDFGCHLYLSNIHKAAFGYYQNGAYMYNAVANKNVHLSNSGDFITAGNVSVNAGESPTYTLQVGGQIGVFSSANHLLRLQSTNQECSITFAPSGSTEQNGHFVAGVHTTGIHPAWFIYETAINKQTLRIENGRCSINNGAEYPEYNLYVNGTFAGEGYRLGKSVAVGDRACLLLNSNASSAVDIIFRSGTYTKGTYGDWAISSRGNESGNNDFYILRGGYNTGTGAEAAILGISHNGKVIIGQSIYGQTPAEQLHVIGNILATGAITAGTASDSRLKSNIATLCNASSVLRQLRGVGFDWNALATDKSSYFKGHDVGLIAQEVEALIPSAIGTIWGEYKRLDYAKITPYLVEGWKEHDNEIDRLKARVEELERQVKQMKFVY